MQLLRFTFCICTNTHIYIFAYGFWNEGRPPFFLNVQKIRARHSHRIQNTSSELLECQLQELAICLQCAKQTQIYILWATENLTVIRHLKHVCFLIAHKSRLLHSHI